MCRYCDKYGKGRGSCRVDSFKKLFVKKLTVCSAKIKKAVIDDLTVPVLVFGEGAGNNLDIGSLNVTGANVLTVQGTSARGVTAREVMPPGTVACDNLVVVADSEMQGVRAKGQVKVKKHRNEDSSHESSSESFDLALDIRGIHERLCCLEKTVSRIPKSAGYYTDSFESSECCPPAI